MATQTDINFFISKINREIRECKRLKNEYVRPKGKDTPDNRLMRSVYEGKIGILNQVLDWAKWFNLIVVPENNAKEGKQ